MKQNSKVGKVISENRSLSALDLPKTVIVTGLLILLEVLDTSANIPSTELLSSYTPFSIMLYSPNGRS